MTLAEDQRLLVFYAGKTLIAYRRAVENAENNLDRSRAQRACSEFVAWLIAAARANPTRRNLSVALWALADEDGDVTAETIDDLTERFRQGDQRSDDYTVAYGDTADNDSIFQSETAVTDYGGSGQTPLPSGEQEFLSETRLENNPLATEHEPPAFESVHELVISVATLPPDARRAADDEFIVGDRIEGRYEIADVRRGGMGVVYLCYDHEQREPVALKSFQSRFLNNERAVARFVQEAVTWIWLEKHRYIVQARLVQNIGGRPYIILEHISGPEGLEPDLRSWIEHKRITMPLAIEFGLHISLGMQHATRRVPGLVHRDLKPANILVTHDGIAKVTDFGLVRSLDVQETLIDVEVESDPSERLTRVGAILGTAPYMSPEQCRSADVDVRSDIYAFGCLLYEMLTGQHVFQVRKFEAWVTPT